MILVLKRAILYSRDNGHSSLCHNELVTLSTEPGREMWPADRAHYVKRASCLVCMNC